MTTFDEYIHRWQGSVFTWEDGYEVLAIPSAGTIAYRNWISEALEQLAPYGLPPFEALVLAIIATNPYPHENLTMARKVAAAHSDNQNTAWLDDPFRFLGVLAQLPEEYKAGAAKIRTLQVVFANSHNRVAARYAESIARNLRLRPNLAAFSDNPHAGINFRPYRTLALLADKYPTVDALLKQLNLPELKDEQLPELPETEVQAEIEENLVENLTEHSESRPIGQLVPRLWSGLNLPAHIQQPSGQPMGGVQDITNKGDLSQLLLSEYANDDVTFLSRLANNEALYVQREVPPVSERFERLLLIDSSIKTWGTPKIIEFAAAIAMITHPRSESDCRVFVLDKRVTPVELTSVAGVLSAIGIAHSGLHVAPALEDFFSKLEPNAQREIVLLSQHDSIAHEAVHKVVQANRAALSYLLLANADGALDLYQITMAGRKHLQHLKLPLEQLWQKPANHKPPLQLTGPPANVPASSMAGQHPILFPTPNTANHRVQFENTGRFLLTNDRELFHTSNANNGNKGWELVATNLRPAKPQTAIGFDEKGQLFQLFCNTRERSISLVRLADNHIVAELHTGNFRMMRPMVFDGERFAWIQRSNVHTMSLNGEMERTEITHEKVKQLDSLRAEQAFASPVPTPGIIRKLKSVGITQDGKLFLNALHVLSIYSEEQGGTDSMWWTTRGFSVQGAVYFARIDANRWKFSEGTEIEYHHAGILTLKPAAEYGMPAVHIAVAAEQNVAMATNTHFSGNPFYHKRPMAMMLQAPSTNPLATIKIIKEHLGLSLNDAKELVSSKPPQTICRSIQLNSFSQLYAELQEAGAHVSLRPSTHHDMEHVTCSEFENRFLKPVIKRLLNHAT